MGKAFRGLAPRPGCGFRPCRYSVPEWPNAAGFIRMPPPRTTRGILMNHRTTMTAAFAALALFASASFAANDKKSTEAIDAAVIGSWRSADAKARDADRHPAESLAFWGLKPKMTILEVQPGGGWWTEILAPYAKANKGEFYATASDLDDAALSENAKKQRADYAAKWADQSVYGKVNLVNWGAKSAPLPPNKFDFVLLTRGMHGWVRQGTADANLAKIFAGVKPGGVLAIEQHRAKAGQDPAT